MQEGKSVGTLNKAPLYIKQRKTLLGHDVFGNVQKWGFTPYWGAYDTNRNTRFTAEYGEEPNPMGGPYCEGNLEEYRLLKRNTCAIPRNSTPLNSELFLWPGCSRVNSYY